MAAAFPAGEERRGGRESNYGFGLVQWKRNSVSQVREESQHHEQNRGGASASSGNHTRALHLPLQPFRNSKIRFSDSHSFAQFHPTSSSASSGTLILAIPGQPSSLLCTRFGHLVCLASVACRTFFRRRRPFCAKPVWASPSLQSRRRRPIDARPWKQGSLGPPRGPGCCTRDLSR